jgi:hypothetical protein
MVVLSWGFHKPQQLPNDKGLSFIVDGFKYQGRVQVIYNEGADLFDVRLDNGEIVEDVYLDQLVGVIDNLVEKTLNYEQRVKQEYAL